MSGKSCDKMLSDDQGEFRKPNGVSVAVTAVRDAEEQSGAVVQTLLGQTWKHVRVVLAPLAKLPPNALPPDFLIKPS